MALVGILRPQTGAELAIALAALEAHGIESFVHGRYFGSLWPGLQIESYNTRTIMVPEERAGEAREALMDVLPTSELADESMLWQDMKRSKKKPRDRSRFKVVK